MTVQIGELQDRVVLQVKTETPDGQGGQTVAWQTVDTLHARVQPAREGERVQFGGVGALQAYEVVVWARRDVTPAHRLLWRPAHGIPLKVLEVHGVMPHEGGREYLALTCAEGPV